MTNKTAISMAVAALIAGVASCNSSSSYDYEQELDGSAMVKNFTLVENDKVLADLDSVFFSIDLVSGDIFNADSLPMGTKISALAANITTDNSLGHNALHTPSGQDRLRGGLYAAQRRHYRFLQRSGAHGGGVAQRRD